MPKYITIEGFSFDLDTLTQQLKQDLFNEWFQDTVGYRDYLSAESIYDLFREYSKNPNKEYLPGESHQFNIPKKGFTLRYGLETSFNDRIVYHAFGSLLVENYSRFLLNHVYGFKLNTRGFKKYLFKDKGDEWLNFEAVSRNRFKSGTFIVVADIQNYFETIRISELEKALHFFAINSGSRVKAERMAKANLIIIRLLRKWSNKGITSIPQNRDASSFLGNIYLHKVDIAMAKKGHKLFRFMDDMKIVCPNVHIARMALKDLILELRKLGLTVNSQKSFIAKHGDEKARDAFKETHPVIQQVDKLWKTKKWKNIRPTIPVIKKFLTTQIQNGRTKEKEFSFCLLRLKKIAGCRPTSKRYKFSALTTLLVEEFGNHPDQSNVFVDYFKYVTLSENNLESLSATLLNEERRVYSWQCYLLWQLFVNKGYVKSELLETARQVILTDKRTPSVAGAALYLGAFGGHDNRNLIARHFRNYRSFLLQRAALIATHELSKQEIKSNVDDHVLNHLDGFQEKISTDFLGTYSAPLDPIGVEEICRDLTLYS